MASKTIVTYVSDLSGKEIDGAPHTIEWGFDGNDLSIDLTESEAKAFVKAVDKYLVASTRTTTKVVKPRGASGRGSQVTGTPLDTMAGATRRRQLEMIRAWAKDQDIEVSDRGRIASGIIRSYFEAKGQA